MGFMIEHPDGRRYEVESLDALKQHDGFTIAKVQPRWSVVPEQPKLVKVNRGKNVGEVTLTEGTTMTADVHVGQPLGKWEGTISDGAAE